MRLGLSEPYLMRAEFWSGPSGSNLGQSISTWNKNQLKRATTEIFDSELKIENRNKNRSQVTAKIFDLEPSDYYKLCLQFWILVSSKHCPGEIAEESKDE